MGVGTQGRGRGGSCPPPPKKTCQVKYSNAEYLLPSYENENLKAACTYGPILEKKTRAIYILYSGAALAQATPYSSLVLNISSLKCRMHHNMKLL